MEQRVSLVTLGVSDLSRARGFYEALGWRSDSKPEQGVVFFQAVGMVIALWSREELAHDCAVEDGGAAFGGIALAYNARSPEEVDAVLVEAEKAGGAVVRRGAPTFWGGYSGVFLDLDDHPWEVAHNPFWTLHEDGSIVLPRADD